MPDSALCHWCTPAPVVPTSHELANTLAHCASPRSGRKCRALPACGTAKVPALVEVDLQRTAHFGPRQLPFSVRQGCLAPASDCARPALILFESGPAQTLQRDCNGHSKRLRNHADGRYAAPAPASRGSKCASRTRSCAPRTFFLFNGVGSSHHTKLSLLSMAIGAGVSGQSLRG
jgi:hypothetical protein